MFYSFWACEVCDDGSVDCITMKCDKCQSSYKLVERKLKSGITEIIAVLNLNEDDESIE